MKPIVKICVILSGILFLLGLIGIGIGISMGTTPEQILAAGHLPDPLFDGDRTRLSVTPEPEETEDLQEAAEEFSDSIEKLSEDMPELKDELSGPSGNTYSGEEEYYEFQDIDSLSMDLALCELHIFRHPNEHIAVVADNTRRYFTCRQEGPRLILNDDRPGSAKSNSMDNALRLDLYLPEQEFRDISLDMDYGNIVLVLLSADTVDIENGAGNISIGTLSCNSLNVDAGIGEFTADSIQAFQEADISLGTGTAVLNRYEGMSLELECGIGNAKVIAAGRETDYDYCLEAPGGIILDHREQDHHDSHHEEGSRLEVRHDTDCKIRIQCALGTAELNFMEEQ